MGTFIDSNGVVRRRSGAKQGTFQKKGLMGGTGIFVTAWRYDSQANGIIKLSAFENKKSKKVKSKTTGQEGLLMMFELEFPNGTKRLELSILNLTTGIVWLPKLGFVVNTKKDYFNRIASKAKMQNMSQLRNMRQPVKSSGKKYGYISRR
jgi:hypothetical protein